MSPEKILIADDKEENLIAAGKVIPYATFVKSAKEAIQKLQEDTYDLVITDMKMETDHAGFDVIRECYNKGILGYVASEFSGGYHGNDPLAGNLVTKVRPYVGDFKTLKKQIQTWQGIMDEIKNPNTYSHKPFQYVMTEILKGKKLDGFDMFKFIYDPRS